MERNSHAVMSSRLAKALIEAGVKHYDVGGATTQTNSDSNSITNPWGATKASGWNPLNSATAAPAAVGNGFKQVAQDFTAQNQYSAQLAPQELTNYSKAIQDSYGKSNYGYYKSGDIQAQQQQLANALLAQSQGQGPNPAQAALAESTGQNAKMQAALMASQRGASANAGQIARQAAMQGAAVQQNAVGQAAVLQAQQQLAAQQALAQQQATMGSQNIAEQGVNNQLYATSAGAQNTQNANEIQNYAMAQGINQKTAQANADAVNKETSGIMGGASSLLAMLSKGGEIPDHLHKIAKIYHPIKYGDGGGVEGIADIDNGPVGQSANIKLPEQPQKDSKDSGGMPGLSSLSSFSSMKKGGSVPGKAKVKGDSSKNDVVPALVSPGEIVLPRSVAQAPDAPQRAAEFVRILQQKKGSEKQDPGYGKVLKSKKSLKERVANLEKLCGGGYS